MSKGAGWFGHLITGVSHILISQTHTGAENMVVINSATVSGSTANINITISNISNNYKNYLRNNSGQLYLKIGNMYSGHSKSCTYYGRGNDNPAHNLKKNGSITIYIPSNQINTNYSTTVTVPTYMLTGGTDIGENGRFRVRNREESENWPYVIYKARFCFSVKTTTSSIRDDMNSDTMLVYCTFETI